MKTLTIIDCFITNGEIENDLKNIIDQFKSINSDILLVSSNKVNENIQSKIDFFLYDSRNQLFQKEDYEYFQPWNFWTDCGDFIHYSFYYSKQLHGLSFLVNMFNAINYAKSLGYTHFQKVLYDLKFTQIGLDFIKTVPEICQNHNKKALFYENKNENIIDFKFEYFFSEIDFFLSNVPQVKNETDYRKNIFLEFGSLKFLIAEKYVHHFLSKKRLEFFVKNAEEFDIDLGNMLGGSRTSVLNYDKKYNGCLTRVTKTSKNELVIFSHNLSENVKNRIIKVIKKDNNYFHIAHDNLEKNYWIYNSVPNDIQKIEVFESDIFLYEEFNDSNIKNYIQFKQ
jgi:hypothetical protein